MRASDAQNSHYIRISILYQILFKNLNEIPNGLSRCEYSVIICDSVIRIHITQYYSHLFQTENHFNKKHS